MQFWAVVPAAGRSRRMGDLTLPKQYLPLAGKTVLEWSLSRLLARRECAGVVVVVAEGDAHWSQLEVLKDARVRRVFGGAERADSVAAGLRALALDPLAWVLVHDAARPCLSADELDALLCGLHADPVGGLLAAPVVDTLKRTDEAGRVVETVSRELLWRALTPQMFRHGTLVRALEQAKSQGRIVTDEAQAVEGLGLQPRVIAGRPDNIKITLPEDLRRAERILDEQWSQHS